MRVRYLVDPLDGGVVEHGAYGLLGRGVGLRVDDECDGRPESDADALGVHRLRNRIDGRQLWRIRRGLALRRNGEHADRKRDGNSGNNGGDEAAWHLRSESRRRSVLELPHCRAQNVNTFPAIHRSGVDALADDPLCWTVGMLSGEKVLLRARHEADVAILQAELYDDVATRSRADTRPWRPDLPRVQQHRRTRSPTRATPRRLFSVVELAGDELAGEAVLWGIDLHNRLAHIGLSLRPAFRGRGLGVDVVRVLCRYGFEVRGLHRIQIETLTDNAAMIQAASRPDSCARVCCGARLGQRQLRRRGHPRAAGLRMARARILIRAAR